MALRNPNSHLDSAGLLDAGGSAVILLRSNPKQSHGSGCVSVHRSAQVHKEEEDLLFLECWCCIRWRNSTIRRARGQSVIMVPG